MHDNSRAADDADVIRTRLAELHAERTPKRRGSPWDHCSHCPLEKTDRCIMNCRDEAIRQGWYMPDLF
jgi:hypothetical protein